MVVNSLLALVDAKIVRDRFGVGTLIFLSTHNKKSYPTQCSAVNYSHFSARPEFAFSLE